jgi:hypothetical protein
MCLNDEEDSKKGSKSKNGKIVGENNVDCIFYIKVIIRRKFVPEKQTVNGKFYKEIIKIPIVTVHCVRPEFQESGFRYLLHDNVPAHSSAVLSKFLPKTRNPRVVPCNSSALTPDDSSSFTELKRTLFSAIRCVVAPKWEWTMSGGTDKYLLLLLRVSYDLSSGTHLSHCAC